MKTLTLLRHAKSAWDDQGARDFDRPLNDRGRRAARTIGRALRQDGTTFDAILASPAARVVETIGAVEEGYGAPLSAHLDQRVYLATLCTLVDLVHAADDGAARLLLVGHNPGIEQLAQSLSRPGALRDEAAVKYPTATVAEILFDVPCWRDLREGDGTLTRFIRPRDLDPALGPEERVAPS